MNIGLSQNRNVLAGSSIWLSSCIFMLAVYATHEHMSLPIMVVYLLALVSGGGFLTWGTFEDKNQMKHRLSISN